MLLYSTTAVGRWSGPHGDNELVLSDTGIVQATLDSYAFTRVEGVALNASAGPAPGLVPLNLYVRSPKQEYALTVSATPPAADYAFVRIEAWCFASPAPGRVNLTLWLYAAIGDYLTCGSAQCESTAAASGYSRADGGSPMCYVLDGSSATDWPCRFGGPSVARGDAAFNGARGNYWRGRIWGPQLQLMYW